MLLPNAQAELRALRNFASGAVSFSLWLGAFTLQLNHIPLAYLENIVLNFWFPHQMI